MKNNVRVLVLYGGVGAEREVSLRSGAAIAAALREHRTVQSIVLDAETLPPGILPASDLVFPALHGDFGEDGRLQALLESAGIHYCGSDAAASRLCMDKAATKEIARRQTIPVPAAIAFDGARAPLADAVIAQLGSSLVIKPAGQGSSVGLHFTEHRSALGVTLSGIRSGKWLIEQRIRGRELTVGVLEGRALGVVEIVSQSGVYDYAAKYTPGSTEYHAPAALESSIASRLKAYAEQLFAACGCRDFARIDFLLKGETPYFLEINTLPGLTETSLLPKSAACTGLDFEGLAAALVAPGRARLQSGQGEGGARC